MLKDDDIDATKKKISILKDELNRLVDIEVHKRLRGYTPKRAIVNSGDYDIRKAFGLD